MDQDTNGCDLCEELLFGDFFRFFSALGPLPKVVSLAPGCRMPTCAKQSMLILRRLLLSIVFSHSILLLGPSFLTQTLRARCLSTSPALPVIWDLLGSLASQPAAKLSHRNCLKMHIKAFLCLSELNLTKINVRE